MYLKQLSTKEREKLFDKIASILECGEKFFGYNAEWSYNDKEEKIYMTLESKNEFAGTDHGEYFWFRISDFDFKATEKFCKKDQLKMAQKLYFSYMAQRFADYASTYETHNLFEINDKWHKATEAAKKAYQKAQQQANKQYQKETAEVMQQMKNYFGAEFDEEQKFAAQFAGGPNGSKVFWDKPAIVVEQDEKTL